MSLLGMNMVPCILLEETRHSDGAGGYRSSWQEGEAFDGAITLEKSVEAESGEQAADREVYTVTTFRGAGLGYHRAFRRVSDGTVFRVTGLLGRTPLGAGLDLEQVTAEKWRLPDE